MYTQVQLHTRDDGYALDLTRDQWKLVSFLLDELLGGAGTPAQLRLLVGAGEEEIRSLIEHAAPRTPRGGVTLSVSPQQLHALHALLTHACLRAGSQEAFHRKTGYFAEHAGALAVSIERSLAALGTA